jgi:multidrug efflux system membrane fusion protein
MRIRSSTRAPFALPLAAVLAIAWVVGGCGDAATRGSQRVPIAVARAEQRTVPFEIDATGTIEPIQTATLTAQAGGVIQRILFREGDEVRAGQALFRIDPRPFETAAAGAAAVLARSRAQYQNAQLDLKRAEALAAQQFVATSEVEQKRSDAEALAATVRADSASLATARLNLAFANVRATIGGKTGSLTVHEGDVVRANDTTTPLVTINQIRPIRARFTITQADVPEVRRQRGKPLLVDVAPGEPDSLWIPGRLVFIDNAVDPASGTLLLKAEFPNRDGALWPGEFVRVRMRLFDQSNATVVPAVAVSNSQSGSYLYVVKADTTVEARPVTVQRTWNDLAVIASGVRAGETVVTDGQLRLAPGATVEVKSSRQRGEDTRS